MALQSIGHSMQPQGPARPARWLDARAFAWLASVPGIDLGSGQRATSYLAETQADYPAGTARRMNATTQAYPQPIKGNRYSMMVVWCAPTANIPQQTHIATATAGVRLDITTDSGSCAATFTHQAVANLTSQARSISTFGGDWRVSLCAYDGSTAYMYLSDQATGFLLETSMSVGFSAPSGSLNLGGAAGQYMYAALVLDRFLSADEARRLCRSPFDAFEPRRIWVPQAAITGLPTLSLPTYMPGSLTSSGFRPRVTAS